MPTPYEGSGGSGCSTDVSGTLRPKARKRKVLIVLTAPAAPDPPERDEGNQAQIHSI